MKAKNYNNPFDEIIAENQAKKSMGKAKKTDVTISISIGTKDYEFYNVPEKVGKAVITLLYECEKDDSKICSAESER